MLLPLFYVNDFLRNESACRAGDGFAGASITGPTGDRFFSAFSVNRRTEDKPAEGSPTAPIYR
jgi:hypothetical protein